MYLKSHELSRLVDLFLEHESKFGKWKIILDSFNSEFDKDLTMEQARQKIKYLKKNGRLSTTAIVEDKPKRVGTVNKEIIVTANPKPMKKTKTVDGKKFTEEVRFNENGVYYSTKLIEMDTEQEKDESYILKAHGFDVNRWIVMTVKNNIWASYSKKDKTFTLYASTVTVKPKKQDGWDMELLIEHIKNAPPYEVEFAPIEDGDGLLAITLHDQHFGVSSFETYRQTQNDLINLVNKKDWEKIIITVGSDLFHHNNHRNQTASGTLIQEASMNKAWEDTERFYFPIISLASKKAKVAQVVYIKGNHDETMAWTFVQTIRNRFRKYKNILIDDDFKDYKAYQFHSCFIGLTHGEKVPEKKLSAVFANMFPMMWATSTTRDIIKGHLHKDRVVFDEFGIRIRTVTTGNETDIYHEERGYITSHKDFQVFEYSRVKLKEIHFV